MPRGKAERGKAERGTRLEGRTLTWPTHAAGGIAALWLLAAVPAGISNSIIPIISSQTIGPLAVLAAGAALLPDLDAQRSKIRSLALGPIRPLDPLGGLLYAAWGHRGPLHSLPGLAAFGMIAALPLALGWGWEYGVALLLGYGSHLALDAMTRHGIPLLPARGRNGRWGFGRRSHLLPRPLLFVTGSDAENVFQALLFGLDLLLLLRNLV